jgi:hypothetical protein
MNINGYELDTGKAQTILDNGVENYYKVFPIMSGKSGKRRIIEEPNEELKELQKTLLQIYRSCVTLHKNCTAKVGSNILDNANRHDGSKYLLRVDVQKCYPSISHHMIDVSLQNLVTDPHTLFGGILLSIIGLCTYKHRLPTGAPTSPFLCNVAFYPIDVELTALAAVKGYTYTRYIDDLHFSTKNDVREWKLIDDIYEILGKYSLQPNKKKTKWYTNNETDNMIVTGVRIGTTEKVPREFRRKVRARLNNLAMKGNKIDAETNGCLAYIKSIDSNRYQTLLEYYEKRKEYSVAIRECTSIK